MWMSALHCPVLRTHTASTSREHSPVSVTPDTHAVAPPVKVTGNVVTFCPIPVCGSAHYRFLTYSDWSCTLTNGLKAHLCLVYLLVYLLATFKVILGWVLTCDSVHSWLLYRAASLGRQASSSMTWYPTQSHYPDTEPASPCSILIMPSARLGNDKYQF